jgi:hypothetical protein
MLTQSSTAVGEQNLAIVRVASHSGPFFSEIFTQRWAFSLLFETGEGEIRLSTTLRRFTCRNSAPFVMSITWTRCSPRVLKNDEFLEDILSLLNHHRRLIGNGRDAAIQLRQLDRELLVVSVRPVLQNAQRHRLT